MEMEGKDIGRVEVWSYARSFFNGFWELTTDRIPTGFGGSSGIPYPSKIAWLQVNADPSLWELGLYCFRVMDGEYMSYQAARAELERKKSKNRR